MLSEALRYLGVEGEADDKTLRLVSECMDLVLKAATPAVKSRIFTREEFVPFLFGDDLNNFLGSAEKVLAFVATLGHGVDLIIRKAQAVDMAKAAALDACAAALIENYCDSVMPKGKKSFERFSPGYGDYPISVQPSLLKALGAEKIGVMSLESFMLIPAKSVTAIIGLSGTEEK